MDNPVLGVEVVGGLAIVNFDGSVRDLGLEEIFAGTIFIEQIVSTVLEFDEITHAELRLEGSCEEMDRALSGVGCTRYDQAERESFQQFQQEESR